VNANLDPDPGAWENDQKYQIPYLVSRLSKGFCTFVDPGIRMFFELLRTLSIFQVKILLF
jgi:hypothetical protein